MNASTIECTENEDRRKALSVVCLIKLRLLRVITHWLKDVDESSKLAQLFRRRCPRRHSAPEAGGSRRVFKRAVS